MMTIVRIAFRNLLQARRRTLLMGFAIGLVAMLFLILRSVSNSIGERLVESATTLSAGHVNVGGFFKTRAKSADPLIVDREETLAFVRKEVPEAVAVIDRQRGWGRIVSSASSINAGLSGIIPEQETRFFKSLRLAPESEYKKGGSNEARGSFDDLKQPNSVLIFSAQAKKLEVGVGDTLTVVTEASGGQSNTVDLRVAAVASDIGFMSNWNMFMPRQNLIDLYRLKPDTTGAVMIYLANADDSQAVMSRLKAAFEKAGRTVMDHDPKPFFMKFDRVMGEDFLGQRLDLTIWSDEVSFVLWITTALDAVSFFVVGILAIIIVGGILNSMWMAVRERTKEIGTMRAIGTPKSFIVGLFLAEAALLGTLASLAGALAGVALLAFVNTLQIPITNDGVRLFLMANTMKFNLHVSQVVTTLVLFALVTGLAALYPALKAAGLRPVEALMQTK